MILACARPSLIGARAWRQARFAALASTLAAGVVLAQSLPELHSGTASAQALASVSVTGIEPNNSSARVSYQPVAGAKDYRLYDVAAPNSVKYAGQTHLGASAACPGPYCQN